MSTVLEKRDHDFVTTDNTNTHGSKRSVLLSLEIARNTFREAVRDRILYGLVLFVLILTTAAIFLGELSAGQETKIIVDLGLSAMLVFGAFIAFFVGVGLVYKEIDKKLVYVIFSKPVTRGQFLFGKYLGLCITLAVNIVIMGIGISLALIYVSFELTELSFTIWPAILLIYTELAVLTAVALLFSTFSSPALSFLLSFAIFIIGHFTSDLLLFAESLGTSSIKILISILYYTLPNLSHFNHITPSAHGLMPSVDSLLLSILYALTYITVLLALSLLIFRRRNFK
jgi:ABC-type transport system involved in multi-copper enzyme maturation permease subunit